MSTSYVVMFIVAALVIVGDLIYELVRKPDNEASLSELFDECISLAQSTMERAQAAGKPTLIHVYTPPRLGEDEWSCEVAQVWLADNGLFMVGYYAHDPQHTPWIYRRLRADLPPDTLQNRCYAVMAVTSVWQKSKIERVKSDLQAIAA